MAGDVSQSGPTITVPPFAFIQNGLYVEKDDVTSIVAPTMVAPYFLTVTSPNAQNTNNLSFQFAKAASDVTENEVIIAEYDGLEWRKLPYLAIDELIKAAEEANVDFGRVGPISGLITTLNGGNYDNSAGSLIDKSGRKTILDELASFAVVATDPDWSRVDRLVYRRPNDAEERIGVRKLLIGGTYSDGAQVLYDTQLLSNSAPHRRVKVLVASDNSVHFFVAEGYGETFEIKYSKYASDRTTQLVAPTTLVSAKSGEFDAALDATGNIHLVYISGTTKDTTWQKFSDIGASISAAVVVYTGASPSDTPRIAVSPVADKALIVHEILVGPSQNHLHFASVDLDGNTVTASTDLVTGVGSYSKPSIVVTDDSLLYVAYEESIAGQILYAVFDDIGDEFQTATVVAASGSAPKICIADNREIFVLYLSGGDVISWNGGVATASGLVGVVAFDAEVDTLLNQVHLIEATASAVTYRKLGTALSVALSVAGASYVTLQKDQLGSLIHAWSATLATTYSDTGAPQLPEQIGPFNYVGTLNTLVLNADEMSFPAPMGYIPKVGDRATMAGSGAGNNGVYFVTRVELLDIDAIGDTYRVQVTPAFPSAEDPATGNVQFAVPDGNEARFIKSVAEIDQATALTQEELDTDVLLARIQMPGSTILNYTPSTGGIDSDQFGVYGANVVIDWEKTTPGELTIVGGVKVIDLVQNLTYSPADGGFAMSEGDALYLVLDGVSLTPTYQVTPIQLLPWGSPIFVLGFIKDGEFQPHQLTLAGTSQLDSGESAKLGEDLPEDLRARLGLTSELAYVAYPYPGSGSGSGVIALSDDYPTAIGKIATHFNVPIQQVLFVSKNGNDTTGTGSAYRPFLTGKAAQDSISDASSSKKYVIFWGPGTYTEDAAFELKPYVNWVGFSKESTVVRRSDGGVGTQAHALNVAGTTSCRIRIENLSLGTNGLTVNHASGGTGGIVLELYQVEMTGDLVFNGLGGGLDYLQVRNNCEINGGITAHSVALTLYNSIVYGQVEIDDDGVEVPDGFGSASTNRIIGSWINALLAQSTTTDTYTEMYSTHVETTVAVQHLGGIVPPTLRIDAVSYPEAPGSFTTSGTPSIVRYTRAHTVQYNPATPTDYDFGIEPETVDEGLNAAGALGRFFIPFRIKAYDPNTKEVMITASDITLPDGTTLAKTINQLQAYFEGVRVNFELGEVRTLDGLTLLQTFTPVTVANGSFRWYSVNLILSATTADNRAELEVLVIAANSDGASALLAPKAPFSSSGISLGQVVVEGALSGIQTIAQTNITQLGTGSGSGSGSGEEQVPEPADGFQWVSFDKLTAAPDTDDSTLSGDTTGSHDISKPLLELKCDKTKGASTTGINFTLSAAPSYTLEVGNILHRNGAWRKIASIASQTQGTLDAAFGVDIAGETIEYVGGTDSVVYSSGALVQYGQTFPVGAEDIIATQVGFEIFNSGGTTGHLVFEIYATNAGVPTGAALASTADIDVSTLPGTFGTLTVVPLLAPVTLSTGVTYAVVTRQGTNALSGTLTRRMSTVDSYAGGTDVSSADGGSSWSAGSSDMNFRVISMAPVMVSQAAWTKDLASFGDASQKTRAIDFFPNTQIPVINLDYTDSLDVGDAVPDYVDAARVVVAASNDGLASDVGVPTSDKFSPIYSRQEAPNEIQNYPLTTLVTANDNVAENTVAEIAGGLGYIGPDLDVMEGNSFIPEKDIVLKEIVLQLYDSTGATGNIEVAVYETDESGLPTGSPIATSNPVDAATLDNAVFDDVIFTFSGSVVLEKGTTYAYLVRQVSLNGQIQIAISNVNPYANGQRVWTNNGGTTWNSVSGHDFYFQIIGDSTTAERLFLVFFPNPDNAAVTTQANLLKYEVSYYAEEVLLNGGVLNSAFGMTDGTGTPNQCSISVVGGKTRVTFDWNYVPNLNPGTPDGELTVILEGNIIPRWHTGVVGAYYTEVPGTTNAIDLETDLSGFSYSIHVKRMQGTIDTSDQNAAKLAVLHHAIVGSQAQVDAGAATHTSLQAAHDALTGAGTIKILVGTIVENIIWTKDDILVEGCGRGTILDGMLTIQNGAVGNIFRGLKVDGNVTFDAGADGNFVSEMWVGVGSTLTDNGAGNNTRYIQET